MHVRPGYTVEETAIPLFVLRNKIAHGADLRTAATDKRYPVDLTQRVSLTQDSETVSYALILSEAASICCVKCCRESYEKTSAPARGSSSSVSRKVVGRCRRAGRAAFRTQLWAKCAN